MVKGDESTSAGDTDGTQYVLTFLILTYSHSLIIHLSKIVVEKSTVPCRTAKSIARILPPPVFSFATPHRLSSSWPAIHGPLVPSHLFMARYPWTTRTQPLIHGPLSTDHSYPATHPHFGMPRAFPHSHMEYRPSVSSL